MIRKLRILNFESNRVTNRPLIRESNRISNIRRPLLSTSIPERYHQSYDTMNIHECQILGQLRG